MQESDLNRIVFSSFRQNNFFAYKIPDPPGQVVSSEVKRPFDGFAISDQGVFFLEGKLIKGNYSSFNFSILETHQIYSLNLINSIQVQYPNKICYPLVYVAWWVSRQIFDVAFFDMGVIKQLQDSGKNSLIKKEILRLKDKGLFIPIKKQVLDINQIIYRIITIEDIKNIGVSI